MFEKNSSKENIKNPPSEDAFAIIATLFTKKRFSKREIGINALSLTILDLINKDQIKCEIDVDESHSVGSKLSEKDYEVMKNITLRLANKGELKTSETSAINLLKRLNKSKKFNLKDMYKKTNTTAIANGFGEDFISFKKAVESENDFNPNDYGDILKSGKLTSKGKDLKKEWKAFQDYLKSSELSEKYPPESVEENALQIIYAACFDEEKDALALRENHSVVCDFVDKDGYKLLNAIFANAYANITEKPKGDGIFYGVNDKYTIPGGG